MSDALQTARKTLLEPTGLTDKELERLLNTVCGTQIDTADLYFQYGRYESWHLQEGRVKSGSHNIQQGVGIRAISGEKTGLAYSNELQLEALEKAAIAARTISHHGGSDKGRAIAWRHPDAKSRYTPADPLTSLTEEAKVHLLESIEDHARCYDPRVKEVMASLHGSYEVVLVVSSDQTMAADLRPMVRLNVSVIVEQNGKRETGTIGAGGRYTYNHFIDDDTAFAFAEDAARQALVNLDSVVAPAGTMPVVLGPGLPGILLHEAVGHGLEGDFNRKATSAFTGRIGERVASDQCTIVDDGTIANSRGSLSLDDEGTPTKNTVLVENGILKGYLQDKLNASLMNTESTGNGRRESYARLPMPRMTNTYMRSGKYEPDEIIASVKKGLYAVGFSGGQVDITSGKFVFAAKEAYLIENGKLSHPVKGATLIGNGPDVLTRVSMVGNNLELDAGGSTCGKEGQSVPVGVGQPTLLVDELTVGGTDV